MASYSQIKPPCGPVCEKRQVGCRSSCEAWKEYEARKRVEYATRAVIKRVSGPGPGKIACAKAKQKRQKRGRK